MLCSKDFFNRCQYNNETKEQMWMSIIGDAHDSMCSCQHTYAHLLACIFPIGHTDRDKTINYILARDYKEKCLASGGGDADIGGVVAPGTKEKEEGDFATENKEEDQQLAELLAAAEENAGTR